MDKDLLQCYSINIENLDKKMLIGVLNYQRLDSMLKKEEDLLDNMNILKNYLNKFVEKPFLNEAFDESLIVILKESLKPINTIIGYEDLENIEEKLDFWGYVYLLQLQIVDFLETTMYRFKNYPEILSEKNYLTVIKQLQKRKILMRDSLRKFKESNYSLRRGKHEEKTN